MASEEIELEFPSQEAPSSWPSASLLSEGKSREERAQKMREAKRLQKEGEEKGRKK